MPDVLYEEVIEVEERVILRQDSCQLPRNEPKRIVTGEQLVNIYCTYLTYKIIVTIYCMHC